MDLTESVLKGLCRQQDLYITPSLNDVLYCNFGGFTSLTGLKSYRNVKSIFLEGNALEDLSTLPFLPQLKCLYLQNNAISTLHGISSQAPQLHCLNVSRNQLATLEGLAGAAHLSTLLCAENSLESLESLLDLKQCKQMHTLDLQDNVFTNFDGILELLRELPELRCLYLAGNPLVRQAPNYRKRLIAALPQLCFLDDRPIFDKERRFAEAWASGGLEAQRDAMEMDQHDAAATRSDPQSVLAESEERGDDSRTITTIDELPCL